MRSAVAQGTLCFFLTLVLGVSGGLLWRRAESAVPIITGVGDDDSDGPGSTKPPLSSSRPRRMIPKLLPKFVATPPQAMREFGESHPGIHRTLEAALHKSLGVDAFRVLPCVYKHAERNGLLGEARRFEGKLAVEIRVRGGSFEIVGLQPHSGDVDDDLARCLQRGWRWIRVSAIAPGEPDATYFVQTGFSIAPFPRDVAPLPTAWEDPEKWDVAEDGSRIVPPGWDFLNKKRKRPIAAPAGPDAGGSHGKINEG